MTLPTDQQTPPEAPHVSDAPADFERLARSDVSTRSTLAELGAFVRETRAYWLVPMLLTLVLFAALLALSSTAAAPFVYTLF